MNACIYTYEIKVNKREPSKLNVRTSGVLSSYLIVEREIFQDDFFLAIPYLFCLENNPERYKKYTLARHGDTQPSS